MFAINYLGNLKPKKAFFNPRQLLDAPNKRIGQFVASSSEKKTEKRRKSEGVEVPRKMNK